MHARLLATACAMALVPGSCAFGCAAVLQRDGPLRIRPARVPGACLAPGVARCRLPGRTLHMSAVAEEDVPYTDVGFAPADLEQISRSQKLLKRLRENLRANLAKEKVSSDTVDDWRSAARSVGILLSVAFFAYHSVPSLLELLTPLSVARASAGTATAAVTGVFMAPLGIVFGTLTSMTANVLRARQLNVREVFYKEVAALDALSNVLAKLFQRDPRRLLSTQAAVFRYCELARTQVEPGAGMSDAVLSSFFAQRAALGTINGMLASISDREVASSSFNFSPAQAGSDAGRAWDLVNQILQLQASRSANVEHQFPPAHFALMAALGVCLPCCFVLVILWGAPELIHTTGVRVAYTVMCAILAAVANFLLAMNEPFSGIYAVQPRRLRVVQAGVINFMSRAEQRDAQSFDEFITGYKTLWADPS